MDDGNLPPPPHIGHHPQHHPGASQQQRQSYHPQQQQLSPLHVHQQPQHFQTPTIPTPTSQQGQFHQQHGSPSSPPSSSVVDEILKRKRKAREYKACYPCRQRKVKCDQNVPCKTCIVREHPELCTYHPPSETHPPAKRPQMSHEDAGAHVFAAGGPSGSGGDAPSPNGLASYNSNGTVTVAREDWERLCAKLIAVERSLADLRSSIGHASSSSASPPLGITGGGSGGGTYHHRVSTYPFASEHDSDTPPSGRAQPLDSVARHVTTQGIHTRNDLTGGMVHLGGASVPALIVAMSRGGVEGMELRELLGKNTLPLFGLDNESSTYPFVDLWGLPHGSAAKAMELAKALPNDSECLNFFRFYKDTAHPIFPAINDVDKFESDLLLFLINRAGSQSYENESKMGQSAQTIYGQSMRWVGLLFAALASGCQCSALPRKERELTSQVFACCSFECLRFTNFLTDASIETIQTMLVVGNVITNNMNAGVAWSLLGLTIRLAQTQGLHRVCPPSTPVEVVLARKKTWWSVVWQDSLLSITYDRATETLTNPDEIMPFSPTSTPGHRSYSECMYRLCKIALDIVHDRARAAPSTTPAHAIRRITAHHRALLDIMRDAADYLKDSRRCRSIRDQLEHWALYLHMSYTTSELCRPAISPNSRIAAPDTADPDTSPASTADPDASDDNDSSGAASDLAAKRRHLRRTCIDSLANTVEAFLGLQNMTPFACRSWAAVHRSLSSALLLGLLGEPARGNERARALLTRLVAVLGEVVQAVDDPAELSGPVTRSVAALRKILARQGVAAENGDGSGEAMGEEPTEGTGAGGVAQQAQQQQLYWAGEDPALMGYSPNVDARSDDSPHALMDLIIWGTKQEPWS